MTSFTIYRGVGAAGAWSLSAIRNVDASVIKIGSGPSSHVLLDAADGVSRMHAVVEITDDGMQIIDLGNEVGTIVNGQRVNKSPLQPGDEILVGRVRIIVDDPGGGDRPESPVPPAPPVHAPSAGEDLGPALKAEQEGDILTAIARAREVLARDAFHAGALDLLERGLELTQMWIELLDVLEKRNALSMSHEEIVARTLRMADIYEKKLWDLDRAAELRERATRG